MVSYLSLLIVSCNDDQNVGSIKTGSAKEANDINNKLQLLHKSLFFESNPIPAKKAMELMGKAENGIRPPLIELAPEYLPGLKEALHENGCI